MLRSLGHPYQSIHGVPAYSVRQKLTGARLGALHFLGGNAPTGDFGVGVRLQVRGRTPTAAHGVGLA